MASLLIRNVDETLHARLKTRAAEHHHCSLEEVKPASSCAPLSLCTMPGAGECRCPCRAPVRPRARRRARNPIARLRA